MVTLIYNTVDMADSIFVITPCHWVTYENVTAMPLIVDRSLISVFSQDFLYVCFSAVLSYCARVINILKLDV
jgi:hypothetical protein